MLASIKDLRGSPAVRFVVAHLLWGKLLNGVKPSRTIIGTQTQAGIPARPHQQFGTFRNVGKAGAVAEAAVAGEHEDLSGAARLIQFAPQLPAHIHKAARQILLLNRGAVLLLHLFCGFFARAFHARDFLKANGQCARTYPSRAMQRQQQGNLQKAQSEHEIDMKGRR